MTLTEEDFGLSRGLPLDALDRLVQLHQETCRTNRLARFLGSAVHAAFLFMLMAAATVMLTKGHAIGRNFSWALLILIGVAGLLFCNIRTHAALSAQAPFLRAAKTLRLVFLYMGLAWGTGAFLVLPADAQILPVLFFVAFPSVALAFLVPDAAGFSVFLVPNGLMVIATALIRAPIPMPCST